MKQKGWWGEDARESGWEVEEGIGMFKQNDEDSSGVGGAGKEGRWREEAMGS